MVIKLEQSEIGIERFQPFSVFSFYWSDWKNLEGLWFSHVEFHSSVLQTPHFSKLPCLHHGLGTAASPLDRAIPIASNFHERNVQSCVEVCCLNVMLMGKKDEEWARERCVLEISCTDLHRLICSAGKWPVSAILKQNEVTCPQIT